jgi:hypothetical protein
MRPPIPEQQVPHAVVDDHAVNMMPKRQPTAWRYVTGRRKAPGVVPSPPRSERRTVAPADRRAHAAAQDRRRRDPGDRTTHRFQTPASTNTSSPRCRRRCRRTSGRSARRSGRAAPVRQEMQGLSRREGDERNDQAAKPGGTARVVPPTSRRQLINHGRLEVPRIDSRHSWQTSASRHPGRKAADVAAGHHDRGGLFTNTAAGSGQAIREADHRAALPVRHSGGRSRHFPGALRRS